MCTSEEKLEIVKRNFASFKDFPKKGVLFRDVFSVLRCPGAFKSLIDLLTEHLEELIKKHKIESIVGLDSRGFLFGPILSLHFNLPFVPVRKKGKLPGATASEEYTLEYGKEVFEIQLDCMKSGQHVVVVDDLLATGGSLAATCQLLKKLGVSVVECVVVAELQDLKGREKVPAPVHSLIQYWGSSEK